MPDAPEIGFEAALNELTAIVAELESGGPDLTTALDRYARGVQLLNRCQGLLDGAERSVALLTGVSTEGTPETAPFDASATAVAVAPTPVIVPPVPLPVAPVAAAAPPKPRKTKPAAPASPPVNPTPILPAWEPDLPDDPDNPGPPW